MWFSNLHFLLNLLTKGVVWLMADKQKSHTVYNFSPEQEFNIIQSPRSLKLSYLTLCCSIVRKLDMFQLTMSIIFAVGKLWSHISCFIFYQGFIREKPRERNPVTWNNDNRINIITYTNLIILIDPKTMNRNYHTSYMVLYKNTITWLLLGRKVSVLIMDIFII